MAMIAPFYKMGAFGYWGFVVSALVVGFGFGFFIERGGLGDARKLTGQFYLRDFTVLRVMFSAIVVAMLGILSLSLLGVLDLREVYINPAFVWPMIVGGLLVGLGFAIGGYCPGTSLVAAVNGKIDGLVFMVGLLLGIFLFGELYNSLAGFTRSGALAPPATLDSWLGVSPATVGLIVVAMALFAFWGGGKLEARFGAKEDAR
jgi:uncharacterized protein